MPPQKDSAAPRVRAFQKDKYDLKNLKFLGEFMSALGLNTTTAGEKIGISQVAIYYWLKKDDARLSAVTNLIEACGYKLTIELVSDPAADSNDVIIIEKPHSKKLSFLVDALADQDKEALAKKIGIGFSTIYYWFEHDDIYVSYIYQIAEAIGKKVKITIRPQKNI